MRPFRTADLLQVMFLFTDAHVVEEGFLELVNNMLSTSMVPALFSDAERDALVDCVRDEVRAAMIFPSRLSGHAAQTLIVASKAWHRT